MRRPLKPFVTEYKGSRRGASPYGDTASFDSERPTSKTADVKLNADSDSEDSYEAAMRAADALFAAPSGSKAHDSKTPDSTTKVHEAPRLVPASAQDASAESASPSERGGGRILRAIDEAPPPQFAALEAEYAPRRRGRKPGSKNKPKVAPTPATGNSGLPAFANAPMASTPIAAAPPVPAPLNRIVALSAATTPDRTEKKFAWVRDRLKPGEDWKRRRLPRVCW